MPQEKDLFRKSRRVAVVVVLLTAACWNHASSTLGHDWTHADSDPNSAERSLYKDDDDDLAVLLCALGAVAVFVDCALKTGDGFIDVTSLDQTRAGRKTQVSGYVNGGCFANTYGACYNGGISAGSESGFALNGAYIAALKEP